MGWIRKGRQETTSTDPFEVAETYLEAGRLDEAIPFLEQTLAHYTRALGADDPDTSTIRTYLAAAYQAGGGQEAIPLFETTLADCERA